MHRTEHDLQRVRLYPVVTVDEIDKRPTCRCKANVTSGTWSAMGGMNYPDARVTGGQFVTQQTGAIGTFVINEQQLP